VLEAVHREPGATCSGISTIGTWARRRRSTSRALDIAPGVHVVTVVDGGGNRLSRGFEVLGESR